jgi:hypothetical protein
MQKKQQKELSSIAEVSGLKKTTLSSNCPF